MPPIWRLNCHSNAFCVHSPPPLWPPYRSHLTTFHGRKVRRQYALPKLMTVDRGLPACPYCFQKFFAWHTYRSHVECATCQVHPPAIYSSEDAFIPDPSVKRPLRVNDLKFLLSSDNGRRLLRVIGSKDWPTLLQTPSLTAELKDRCVLCGVHQARPQSLDAHLKQQRGAFFSDVISKTAQFVRAFACDKGQLCSKTFQNAHRCPVWTQVVNLYLRVPFEITPRPEVCKVKCRGRGHRQFWAHLQTHKLVIYDWRAARDVVTGAKTCRRCSQTFQRLNGFQQRIIFGICPSFDPDAGHVSLPICEELMNIFLQGHALEIVKIKDQLRMSARCLCCGKEFDRPLDLRGRLQQQHGDSWFRAQPLVRLLVQCAMDLCGCICAPPIEIPRGDHQCLPLLQLAMQYYRTDVPYWVPFPMDGAKCLTSLALELSEELSGSILAALAPGNLDLL